MKTNEYEYVSKDRDFKMVPPSQKSPRRTNGSLSPPLFNTKSYRSNVSLRLKELGLPEIPKHNLVLLKKVGQGVFGTV